MGITWRNFVKCAAPSGGTFILNPNDTVYRVALNEGLTVDDIVSANGGLNPRRYRAGVPYKLPARTSGPARSRRSVPVTKKTATPPATGKTATPPVARTNPPPRVVRATPAAGRRIVYKEPEVIEWHPEQNQRHGYGTEWGIYRKCHVPGCTEEFGMPNPAWGLGEQRAWKREMDRYYMNHQSLKHGGGLAERARRFQEQQKKKDTANEKTSPNPNNMVR